ncbi:MAG: signal recognition particle protein [Acidimicrobiia bacterium]|nr:signal recognition particle protein [Acidimicrobiia bacterium]
MFDALSERFEGIFGRLRARGRLSDKDVDAVAREIRLALLEADVNVAVVKAFIARVKERAHESDLSKSLSPAQQIIKIVHEELVATLGSETRKLTTSSKPPTVVMLAGLQGSGKTTAAGKLARHLGRQGLRPLLVAADLQRPAAIKQLEVLGERIEVPVFAPDQGGGDPVAVAAAARDEAARLDCNLVIVDTAGRLHVDEVLMDELRHVHDVLAPHHTLLVVDAMTGQEAVNVAESFDAAVDLDGLILTKIDGDARGGAALSAKEVTGKPILYVGTGEKLGDFDVFHPDRMASRILGMGDMLTLIEKAEETFDQNEAAATEEKIRKGEFTLEDFLDQMRQVRKMGPLQSLVGMMPGVPKELKDAEVDEGELGKVEAIICSMTPEERRNPTLVKGSRRLRIASGSGTTPADVNALLKQFKQVQQMMRSVASGKQPKIPVPGL